MTTEPARSGSAADDPAPVRGLWIPADPAISCAVVALPRQVRKLALVAGSGPLHPDGWCAVGEQEYRWCGERRGAATLDDNPRAAVLAARLAVIDLADRIGLRGDLILTGTSTEGRLVDVPQAVIEAAHRGGLFPHDFPPNATAAGSGDQSGSGAPTTPPDRSEWIETVGELPARAAPDRRPLPRRPQPAEIGPLPPAEPVDPKILSRVLVGLRRSGGYRHAPPAVFEAGSWWGL